MNVETVKHILVRSLVFVVLLGTQATAAAMVQDTQTKPEILSSGDFSSIDNPVLFSASNDRGYVRGEIFNYRGEAVFFDVNGRGEFDFPLRRATSILQAGRSLVFLVPKGGQYGGVTVLGYKMELLLRQIPLLVRGLRGAATAGKIYLYAMDSAQGNTLHEKLGYPWYVNTQKIVRDDSDDDSDTYCDDEEEELRRAIQMSMQPESASEGLPSPGNSLKQLKRREHEKHRAPQKTAKGTAAQNVAPIKIDLKEIMASRGRRPSSKSSQKKPFVDDEKREDNEGMVEQKSDAIEDLAREIQQIEREKGRRLRNMIDVSTLTKDPSINISSEKLYVIPAKAKEGKRIIVLMAGLNAKLQTLMSLAELLSQNEDWLNFTVFIMRLPGHNPKTPAARVRTTQRDWETRYSNSLRLISNLASVLERPLYTGGHSTGCSVNSSVLASKHRSGDLPKSLVGCMYFAPADGLGDMSSLLGFLPTLKAMGLPTVKNMGSTFAGDNAVHRDMPICLFDCLDGLIKTVRNDGFVYAPVPILCCIDPRDTLISVEKTKAVFKAHKAPGKVDSLKNSGGSSHMCMSTGHPAMRSGEIKRLIKQFVETTESGDGKAVSSTASMTGNSDFVVYLN